MCTVSTYIANTSVRNVATATPPLFLTLRTPLPLRLVRLSQALAEKQKYADSALGALVKIAHSQRSTWPSTLTSEEENALEKWLEYATEKIPKVEG